MTKATCICGATLETESVEMLNAWGAQHVMCRFGSHPLPSWPAPIEPFPWIPEPPNYPGITWTSDHVEFLTNQSDFTWRGETSLSCDALAAIAKAGGWHQ